MSQNIFTFFATRKAFLKNRLFQILVLLFVLSWFYFLATSREIVNWWIENILVLLFVPWFYFLNKKFQLSNLSLTLLFLFLWIHIYGAQMSYTHNTVGEWLKEQYHLWRNPYDRFVHFNFGFLMVIPIWDYLVHRWAAPKNWSYLLACSLLFCLATFFELIEWFVAAVSDKETGETYVATQGDVWDAHKDIALAWLGAAIMMSALYLYLKRNSKQKC